MMVSIKGGLDGVSLHGEDSKARECEKDLVSILNRQRSVSISI
jgi:hypothetical protein